jgi:cytochrome P450
MESLRAHPTLLMLPYTVVEPFTFAARRVERGEQVGMAMSAAHWLPEPSGTFSAAGEMPAVRVVRRRV